MMMNSMTMNHHPLVMKAANSLSVVKAGGNKSNQFTRLMPRLNNFTAVPAAAAAKATAKTTTKTTTTRRKTETLGPGLGDPCLDLFFGVQENTPAVDKYHLLMHLLPAAWSHDPLTTLKLICNLLDISTGKFDHISFYRAAVWLHHNHPKTLASNVLPIFFGNPDSVGDPRDLTEIFKRLTRFETRISKSEDYRLLHNRVSDILADHLRRNIQDMKKQKPLRHYYCLCHMDGLLPLFGESIAKKLFPRKSCPEYKGLEESLYVDRVRDRLWDEVVEPLILYYNTPTRDSEFGRGSYLAQHLKAAASGSLLPYQIVNFAINSDRDVAQLLWKRMVKKVYLKQGKFKNCLVVCNTEKDWTDVHVALSLAVLVSQLSGGPWKGKVISSGPNPELHDLPGSDLDLLSNCAFLKRIDYGLKVDIPKVFDVILQVAANANLPPDQMVKKVFLVTIDDLAEDSWESDYQAILTKYKEKGYGQDAVPQFVHWNIEEHDDAMVKAPRSRPGLTTLFGFSYDLFKLFLDNGGQFGPYHVVEVATCEPQYQNLVVVD